MTKPFSQSYPPNGLFQNQRSPKFWGNQRILWTKVMFFAAVLPLKPGSPKPTIPKSLLVRTPPVDIFRVFVPVVSLRSTQDGAMDCWRVRLIRLCLLACLLAGQGCARMMNVHSVDRQSRGYTLVLNGIEGAHVGHAGFVTGLKSGGVDSEIEVVDWTTGTPALMLMHLRHETRNRHQAEQIAAKIVQYQDQHPGRPVNLVGHSGGGAMVLLTLEALPSNRRIDSAILLAAAISPDYDLRPALQKVDRGLWNYSSFAGDSVLLVAGTTAFGTVDGRHTISAGAVGFRLPPDASEADRQLYRDKLFERPYRPQMALSGNLSDHYGPMNPLFARNELAPILNANENPDPVVQAGWSGTGAARPTQPVRPRPAQPVRPRRMMGSE
jgi:pimeloyl-ACP methyl ester carboxylesterase